MAAFTQIHCADFMQFQETLKKMRLLDDTIIYALNVQLPTESFNAQEDCQASCKELYNKLNANYTAREEAFNKCLEYSKSRVSDLRAQRDKDENNIAVLKELRKEQTKIRLLENELGVDEVIKGRTKKVYYERCRNYFLPENFYAQ